MVDKKAVAIILALGLLVSIGIALGQNKYAQDIAAKQAAGAEEKSSLIVHGPQETIVPPSPQETIENQAEWIDMEMAIGAEVTTTPPTSAQELERAFDSVSSIDSYQIVQSPFGEPDFILCYWRDQPVARLHFDPAVDDHSGHVYEIKVNGNRLLDLVFASSSFNDVVNTLREETRIGIGYRLSGARPYGAIISGPSSIGQLRDSGG